MKIVLGSKSIRRSELLRLIGYDFSVDSADIDENIESFKGPRDYVEQVVELKGLATFKKHQDKLIICADTIVVVDEIILGKPSDKEDARRMIKLISDRQHSVMTAVYIQYKNYKKIFTETTIVEIDKINAEEIEFYINTDEPYDKSGGYAIQGWLARYVKGINGDFYNVMGLPINKLHNEIKKIIKKYS